MVVCTCICMCILPVVAGLSPSGSPVVCVSECSVAALGGAGGPGVRQEETPLRSSEEELLPKMTLRLIAVHREDKTCDRRRFLCYWDFTVSLPRTSGGRDRLTFYPVDKKYMCLNLSLLKLTHHSYERWFDIKPVNQHTLWHRSHAVWMVWEVTVPYVHIHSDECQSLALDVHTPKIHVYAW